MGERLLGYAEPIVNFTYDALDRLTFKDRPGSTAADVSYGYDLLGRLTDARYSANNQGVANAYDALGRVTATGSNMGGIDRAIAYQHDAAGNRTRITHPDGAWFAMAYDVLGRMTNAEWVKGSIGPVPFMGIGYDDLGRRTGIGRASSTTGYSYDAVSRLSGLTQGFAGGAWNASASFAYNPAGQIASRTEATDSYAWTGHFNQDKAETPNGLNQLVQQGAVTLTFDGNGNLTSDGSTTYTYDVENRLISATGAKNAVLSYDPLGRLSSITSGANTTRFVYDGLSLVAEYDGSGNLLRRYMHAGPDEPIMWDEGSAMDCSGSRFLHTDERGSVVAAANCFGNRTDVNAYDEYGTPASTNTGRFGYTGQTWLAELGLWYYKARMYAPQLGRFMQSDPIGYGSGINLYGYVAGDPINLIDPLGLEEEGVIVVKTCRVGQQKVYDPREIGGLRCEDTPSTRSSSPGTGPIGGGRTPGEGGGEAPPPPDCGTPGADPENCTIVVTALSPCQQAVDEPGYISVGGGTLDVILTIGVTGSVGQFKNLSTGTTGYYATVGLGAGGSVGIGGQSGSYRSVGDLIGYADNVSASFPSLIKGLLPDFASTVTRNLREEIVGVTAGGSKGFSFPNLKFGAQASFTETFLFSCAVGG